jgi:chemotaxis protein MotB
MAKAPPQKEVDEGLPEYFATFADMMTLLMTFFVLLFSMSTLDPVKIADMAAAMQENMTEGAREKVVARKSHSDIHRELSAVITKLQMEENTEVTHSPKGTTITIDSRFAFEIGSAALKPEFYLFLDNVIPIMRDPGQQYPIAVEGHTDNLPIAGAMTEIWPTNWELSAARAASVVRYCIEKGVPGGRLRAVGFADRIPYDTKWEDIRGGRVSEEMIRERNSTAELRAKNRRVEITFLSVG